MIHVEHVTKRYGALTAVSDVSFTLDAGETFAIVGPNGAGKTTTLKMLLGLVQPDAGTIALGADKLPPRDPRARRTIGYVPQRADFPPARTVEDVLRFYADVRGLGPDAADRAMHTAGLADYRARRAGELSGGYTQRLALAQALLGDPSVLILDEPTASLDPEATWEFRSLIERLQEHDTTILLCSHLLGEVERIADRVMILVAGRSAAIERLSDLRERQVHATRLIVDVDTAQDAAFAALTRSGVSAERYNNHAIVVHTVDGAYVEPLDALKRAGVPVRTFELHRPTLEEVFLRVVQAERDNA